MKEGAPCLADPPALRRMPGDSILLPNGKVIILNGAQVGVAGDSSTGGSSKV